VSERGAPFSKRDFQAMVERATRAAGFDTKIDPHMLRYSCGYKLTNDGVDPKLSTLSDTPSSHRRALKAYFGTEWHA
jgi:site-specific recombinase XerD